MRYLVLSDIHSNLTALEAVLENVAGRWEKLVCLGDVVGYGPDPNQVLERIRALDPVIIRGNHDKAVAGLGSAEDFHPAARGAAIWARDELSPENRTFLCGLPRGPRMVDNFAIAHGSPHDEDRYIFTPEDAWMLLQETNVQVTFIGHTHMQCGFELRGNRPASLRPRPLGGRMFEALAIERGSKYLLNPGSVGQPRDGDPRAAFAIADLDRDAVEFWRVPYDVQAVQKRMARAGLPEPLIARLAFGR